MVVKIEAKVFWVVTTCGVVVGYQHFRGPCCLHLQFTSLHFASLYSTLNVEAAKSSETLIPYFNTTWHHNPEGLTFSILETQLTPWNRVILEKLIVTQLVSKFPMLCET
jgi:hypothetical protein